MLRLSEVDRVLHPEELEHVGRYLKHEVEHVFHPVFILEIDLVDEEVRPVTLSEANAEVARCDGLRQIYRRKRAF